MAKVTPGTMSQIFISYARSEADQAHQISESLRGLGFSVWRDDQLPAHRAYTDVIEERLHAAKAVVVLWSETSVKSQWVRAEAEVARQAGRLVQVQLDDAVLPLPFSQIQCADLRGWTGDPRAPGLGKVVDSVTALIRAAAAVDAIKPVDLAREPDFQLGGVLVSPSAARVRSAAGEQKIEPRVMEVLVVLATHAGRTVTRDELIEACWGGRVVSDDAVNRVIAQVRALGRSLEPPPFVVETVPKVGVRLIAGDAADAPPGLAPATPAASARPAEPAPVRTAGRGLRPRTWTLIAGGVAAVAVLAVAGVLAWRAFKPASALGPGQNGRVDVMAFDAPAGDAELGKVASTISTSLIRILSTAGTMVSLTPLQHDAAAGDAEMRVAGSVERQGDTLFVNSQILERKSGVVLLSHRYERPAGQLGAAGISVGQTLAATLHCALEDRKAARAPLSSEAFALYLNACAAVFEGAPSERMLSVTRRLVKAAPDFAGAHAMHAIAAARVAEDADTPAEAEPFHKETQEAADRALHLDPKTAKAWSALAINAGALSMLPTEKWLQQDFYTTKALAIDPDLPPARNEHLTLLRAVGREREAVNILRATNAANDPRNGYGLDPRVAMMLAAQGRQAEAAQEMQDEERLSNEPMPGMRWTIAFWWEDPATALPKLPPLMAADGQTPEKIACFQGYLTRLRAGPAKGLPPCANDIEDHWRVRMLAREGDLDGAFALVDSSKKIPTVSFYYPEMAAFRRDPRFWPLAKRLGLVDYWVKSGHWPDFCAEPGMDCRKAAAGVSSAGSAPARTAGR